MITQNQENTRSSKEKTQGNPQDGHSVAARQTANSLEPAGHRTLERDGAKRNLELTDALISFASWVFITLSECLDQNSCLTNRKLSKLKTK